ncbi:uncharacterized protein UMAG_10115 [Mycosarcoma maydis]|uniref:Uncharacterized protein n=1 Tax=Mycosarcoma maydis TaxID=5270 RepID=A0A0D1D0V7_MYCMD|nr:uncharacterized protein UMAG_10115 [Ustilago maydis 521]KIS72023.1 hypothetical protein UMAG_10115 [Ustilago maydis 521]|eukprot:XP_011386671.1 hypothetical protein UMAG_10115 [Ustilago maydis 521]
MVRVNALTRASTLSLVLVLVGIALLSSQAVNAAPTEGRGYKRLQPVPSNLKQFLKATPSGSSSRSSSLWSKVKSAFRFGSKYH